jgi:hypothetical protein
MPPYQSVSFIIKHSDVLLTTAQEALPISGTIPMSGTLTVPNIKITNGATNGAVWTCTNEATGQGTLVPRIAFRAVSDDTLLIKNTATTSVVCHYESYDYGNSFDGTNFVCPVSGLYEFKLHALWQLTGTSSEMPYLGITFTGSGSLWNTYYSGDTTIGVNIIESVSAILTNSQIVRVDITGLAGATNQFTAGYCVFEGRLIH